MTWKVKYNRKGSCHQGADWLAVHIGQAEATPVVPVGQLFVVDAELVQNGGVECNMRRLRFGPNCLAACTRVT